MIRNQAVFSMLLFSAVAFSVSAITQAADIPPGWTESLKEARAESKKTGKPILADFTGSDW